MSKILIIDDEDDIRELIEIVIASEFPHDILSANCGNKGVELLGFHDDIVAIVCDYNMFNGNGGDVFNYNKSNSNLPFILLTGGLLEDYTDIQNFKEINANNFLVAKPFEYADLIKPLKIALNEDANTGRDNKLKLCKIRTHLVQANIIGSCDIYLEDSKGEFEITRLSIEKISNEHIFLTEDHFQDYITYYYAYLNEQLTSSKQIEDVFNLTSSSIECVNTTLNHFDIDEDQVQLVNACVNKCINQMKSYKMLNPFMKKFCASKDYFTGHSIVTIHIAYLLCKRLGYKEGESLEKLTYAALLHDITLRNTNYSEIIDQQSSNFKSLTEDEQEEIIRHPYTAFTLVQKLKGIPADVDHIIHEHHEKPGGDGYPRGLTATQISPLSCVFIIALRSAHIIYFSDDLDNLKEKITETLADYHQGYFKKPLTQLLKTI